MHPGDPVIAEYKRVSEEFNGFGSPSYQDERFG